MARKKDGLTVFRLLFAIPLLATSLGARELPIRSFTTADGLADNRVVRIVSDSRGLLWICTGGGISRFDGAHVESREPPDARAGWSDLGRHRWRAVPNGRRCKWYAGVHARGSATARASG